MIYDNDITEFIFIQYLFGKQAYLMRKLNWYRDGIERVKHFIAETFVRALRELKIDKNDSKILIFKCIWIYQATNGFLEIFNPKLFFVLDANIQFEFSSNIINVKSHALGYLEKLGRILFNINCTKVSLVYMNFINYFF